MQIISSYGVELRKQNIPIRQTLEIYRSAVSYLIGIYVKVWEELAENYDAISLYEKCIIKRVSWQAAA